MHPRAATDRQLLAVAACRAFTGPALRMAGYVAGSLSNWHGAHWLALAWCGCLSQSRLATGLRVFAPNAGVTRTLSGEKHTWRPVQMDHNSKHVVGDHQLCLGCIADLGGRPVPIRSRKSLVSWKLN